jgi:hypothetical protein
MANDFERLLAGQSRAHRLLDILGVTYFQSVHEFRSGLYCHHCHRQRRRTIQQSQMPGINIDSAEYWIPRLRRV